MKRVLIADDSPLFAEALAGVLTETGTLSVAGVARDGLEAVSMTHALRPDIVLMDVLMPGLDGFEAVSRIMAEAPTPVLMLTADAHGRSGELGFEALRRGALDLMTKPARFPFTPEDRQEIRSRVRFLADVRPIRHLGPVARPAGSAAVPSSVPPPPVRPRVIGLVASTGGPAALGAVLRALPRGFPAGIAVVQHLPPGFVESLARWLASVTPLEVVLATEGAACAPGRVLVAPDHRHLTLDTEGRARLTRAPETTAHRPSGDVLLTSLAATYARRSAGVVLTGMGHDGAAGLGAMLRAGARTIAQDEATSVVFGMPRAAIESGAALQTLALGAVAPALCRMVGVAAAAGTAP